MSDNVPTQRLKSISRAKDNLRRKLTFSTDSTKRNRKRHHTAEIPVCPPNVAACRAYSEGEIQMKEPEEMEKNNTVGFMSLFNDSARYTLNCKIEERNRDKPKAAETPKIVDEVLFLKHAFPLFPLKLYPWLLLRYDGNCNDVYEFLLSRDWEAFGTFRKDLLRNDSDVHYRIPYYHGHAPSPSEIKKIFVNQNPGSFITYYRYVGTSRAFKYIICFKNAGGEVVEKPMKIPEVPLVLRGMWNLSKPIKSCKEEVQSKSNFVPCLEFVLCNV